MTAEKKVRPKKKRVVEHEREITADPPLLTPEEEEFNRFLEEDEGELTPLADSGSDRV